MPLTALSPAQLSWRVPPGSLAFATTAELDPLDRFIAQDNALDALRRGVRIERPGFNTFVVGNLSAGRLATVERVLRQLEPLRRAARDFVYVRNFVDPTRPRLLEFPAGRGLSFRKELLRLATALVEDVPRILNADDVRLARERERHKAEVAQHDALTRLEAHAKELGFVIGTRGEEEAPPEALWVVPGTGDDEEEEPTVLSRAEMQVRAGRGDLELPRPVEELLAGFDVLEKELASTLDLSRQTTLDTLRAVKEGEAAAVRAGTKAVFREMGQRWPRARAWLSELHEEMVDSPEWFDDAEPDHEALFASFTANLVHLGRRSAKAPVILATNPTWSQLFGGIEGEPGGVDHRSIRGGALLDADGGFLVVNAPDMLQEQGVWKTLKRVLMYGELEIQNPESPLGQGPVVLRPDPIALDVKVILVGDPATYAALYYGDPDARNLFKVKCEFEDDAPCTPELIEEYARFFARIARREGLPSVTRNAVCALMEWAVREAGRGGRISTHFARVSDLLRESAYESGGKALHRAHVEAALQARRRRDSLAEMQTLEAMQRGLIRVQVTGEAVGRVNSLVVYHVGGHDFGRPMRITCTVGVGRAGIVSIERESGLSGRTHEKGVQILAGWLREALGRARVLALTASLGFEQSYGRIDGDSASSTELYALLSALSRVPIRQGIAVTGSVDQFGEIQSVGGVNEKIEGFFATCKLDGLDGTQGVLIPAPNVPDLCLAADVVEACEAGRFHVWSAAHVRDGVELLTGLPAGEADDAGRYPEGSVMGRAAAELDRLFAVSRRKA
jgi:predicted ATP-dependent protease